MNSNKMSLVVFSCDAYSDLWDGFFKFMDIYWPLKSFDCFLVNNNKEYKRDGVKVINAGDGDWSTRTKIALEHITTPYVMPFLEDYFISEIINNTNIEDALRYVEDERINYYQLIITGKEDYSDWTHYKDRKYLYNIPKTRNYWVDTSISIWDKDFFLELLGKDEYSAWKFELDRNEEAKHPEKYANKTCVIDSRWLISMCPMVIQGKYYPVSIKQMKQKGYNIDTSNRKIMSNKEVCKYKLKRFFASIPFGSSFFKSIGRKLGYTFMSDLYKTTN